MHTIRNGTFRFMIVVAAFVLILLLAVFFAVQSARAQELVKQDADSIFRQVQQILNNTEQEADATLEEYKETCFRRADAIAYMIRYNPSTLESVNDLKAMADMMQVDEIHIIDSDGKIYAGTHPEYFGYTFDSGTQMRFFKPMLTDRMLRLYQDISPNTAEGKLVQYTAVWSSDGKFIVEIGMQPIKVLNATAKSEISSVFSLLQVGTDADLYAIDRKTGVVMGATKSDKIGEDVSSLGLELNRIKSGADGFVDMIDGENCYCVFDVMEDYTLGFITSEAAMYQGVVQDMTMLGIDAAAVVVILVLAMIWYLNRNVIRNVHKINRELSLITDGKQEYKMEMDANVEFSELSHHISEMVDGLVASKNNISYILNRTNMRIGVYEYHREHKKVRFTGYVSEILELDPWQIEQLTGDYHLLQDRLAELRKNPVPNEPNVYLCGSKRQIYLKLDEVERGANVFGLIADVTREITTRRRIESERDADPLTELLNRRGFTDRLSTLFMEPQELGYGALIMVDSDDLKKINDQFGHAAGDRYLQATARLLRDFGTRENVTGRLGGDEFICLLYGYDNETDLAHDLTELEKLQNGGFLTLETGDVVSIRFSMGYSPIFGNGDYHALLREADENMYENKRTRKAGRDAEPDDQPDPPAEPEETNEQS